MAVIVIESCCHGDHGWQRKQNGERMGKRPDTEGGKRKGLETTGKKEGREKVSERQKEEERKRKRGGRSFLEGRKLFDLGEESKSRVDNSNQHSRRSSCGGNDRERIQEGQKERRSDE